MVSALSHDSYYVNFAAGLWLLCECSHDFESSFITLLGSGKAEVLPCFKPCKWGRRAPKTVLHVGTLMANEGMQRMLKCTPGKKNTKVPSKNGVPGYSSCKKQRYLTCDVTTPSGVWELIAFHEPTLDSFARSGPRSLGPFYGPFGGLGVPWCLSCIWTVFGNRLTDLMLVYLNLSI